jgi:hypothetical protein
MKTISARLGHASISTTMNIYGHALEDADKAAASMFNNFFKVNDKRKSRLKSNGFSFEGENKKKANQIA